MRIESSSSAEASANSRPSLDLEAGEDLVMRSSGDAVLFLHDATLTGVL